MSFSAQLEFGSDKYVILDLDYEFVQPMDQHNRPNGRPKGGIINLSVESSKKNDLLEWMLAPDMQKEGTITIFKRDAAGAALKTIKFSDAFCTRYRERYSSAGNSPMTLSMTISAGQINVNGKHGLANVWSAVKSLASGGSVTGNASFTAGDIMGKDLLSHPENALENTDISGGGNSVKGNDLVKDMDFTHPDTMAKNTFNEGGGNTGFHAEEDALPGAKW